VAPSSHFVKKHKTTDLMLAKPSSVHNLLLFLDVHGQGIRSLE
jgi:hypothetical protein